MSSVSVLLYVLSSRCEVVCRVTPADAHGTFTRLIDLVGTGQRSTGLGVRCPGCYYLDMRILIAGDRHWNCTDLAERVVNRLIARYGYDFVVIHGGACGVDEAFAEACRHLAIKAEPHVADWRGLGNIAGPARKREMVQSGADVCIALHRTLAQSKATKDCVRQALAAGIPVYLIDGEQAKPRRVRVGDERLAR
jgi:YspA, cpYpsA-related SLOG family